MRRFDGVDTRVQVGPMPAWERCPGCASGPAPGAAALMAYWLEHSRPVGSSLGIFNCRPIRGSSALSVHACGRAADLGVPVNAAGHRAAYEFLRRLAPHLTRLGVCYFIFNRTQWSSTRARSGERYAGVHPHYDHIHMELTARAGRELNLATLRAVAGPVDEEDDVYVVRFGQGGPSGTAAERLRVARAQKVLRAAGRVAFDTDLLPTFGEDGHYGTETAAAVNRMAARAPLPAEGSVGMDVLVLDYCRNWLR
jgi:hypothetical protein